MSFSDYALDTFVAPQLSELRKGEKPNMAAVENEFDQARYWVRNFILGSMLLFGMEDRNRKLVFNYLRRVESAFTSYAEARGHLDAYLSDSREAISKYFAAVVAFETMIGQAYHAFRLLGRLIDRRLFDPDDGSPLQRLDKLYVHVRHTEGIIAAGQLPEGYTIPLWIKQTGLACAAAELTFEEIADLLRDLGAGAEKLSAPPKPTADEGGA